jgi:GTP-binding protein
VVDGADRDPEWSFSVIRDELAAHDPALLEKPMLVVFNKLDLPAAAEAWPEFRVARERDGLAAVAVSAETGAGLPGLVAALAGLLPSLEELAEPPEPSGVVVHRIEPAKEAFTIAVDEDGIYRVTGGRIERIAVQTDFENEESAARFQRDLAKLGIDAELRRLGIEPGDTVRIGSIELEWEPEPWEER